MVFLSRRFLDAHIKGECTYVWQVHYGEQRKALVHQDMGHKMYQPKKLGKLRFFYYKLLVD